jgi:HD superfamily phosphohydrolase
VADSFSLDQVRQFAEVLASQLLENYIASIQRKNSVFARKEVNDALWGTISLTPVEVALLDSPLVQRLRSIRQLGVVHWIYPGAVHTRFEHTLGVVHQVQHLVSAVNNLGLQKTSQTLIDGNNIQLLRLCALVHDVGHTAFSHVAEMALEGLPEVNPISAEFSKRHRCELRKLSEIVAYYIIRSPAMKSFFLTLIDRQGRFVDFTPDRTRNVELLIERMGHAIIGQKIDDRLPLLHEIISGPFDADKLDYFVRDARMAGTPSVLDISRLVQKITLRELDGRELPDEILQNVNAIEQKYCIFGIKWSGVPVLDELHLARVLLYAKIYRHPKVIAVEQMFKAAVFSLSAAVTVRKIVRLLYEQDDEGLLGMSLPRLIELLEVNPAELSGDQTRRLRAAVEILHSIKRRELAVRAFQIQKRYPADPHEREDEQKGGLIDFLEEVEHPEQREAFRVELVSEVESVLRAADATSSWDRLDLDTAIMVHSVGQTPGGSQIARAYLLPNAGRPIPFRDYTVNRTAWAASYTTDQPSGYVFAKNEIADAVYLAVEKLLRIRFHVRLPPSALEASKRDPEVIQGLKKRLHLGGYYRESPYDIRPMPDRLRRADVRSRIDRFCDKLAKYQEPQVRGTAAGRALPLSEKTLAWLRQFDDDQFIDCALKLLDRFRMIDRTDTVQAIEKFVGKHPSFRGAVVVPFGSARDSGAVQTYFSADLIGSHISGSKTLDECARSGELKPIIMIDDFVGSGGQGQDILASGFGIESLKRDLGEQRELFDDVIQTHLRRVPVGFVFTAAWDDGLKTISRVAKEAGLNATVYRSIDETGIPFAFDNCLADVDPDVKAKFKEFCSDVGMSLISAMLDEDPTQKAGERAQKLEDRRLGYGNRAMLLASPLNIPTQALTAFWGSGVFRGTEWVPLLARRKKA